MENENQRPSAESKYAMIQRWEQCGKRVVQFCKEENISYHFFHYWRRKFLKGKSASAGRFIKMKPKTDFPSGKYSEVILSNGNRIVFFQPTDVSVLKHLSD